MDITRILSDLRAERNRLDQAIAALEAIGPSPTRGPSATTSKRGRRRRMTAAGRKRLSQLMKARWAARKKLAKGKTA